MADIKRLGVLWRLRDTLHDHCVIKLGRTGLETTKDLLQFPRYGVLQQDSALEYLFPVL